MIWVAGSRILRLRCPILRLRCPILGLRCPILGLCWPTLVLCWPVLGPRLADQKAYVDPCWAKRSEKWEQQKNTVKRRICWWSAAHLGAMLAHLGGYVGHLGGYVAPSWGYFGPFGAMLAHLGGMLAHLGGYVGRSWGYVAHLEAYVGPCWPILSHMCDVCAKDVECHRAKKHCKLQGFLSTRAPYQRSAAGAAAPLSYGEERNAYGKDTARGPLAGFKRLRATAGQGPNYVGPSCGYVGLCRPHVDPCWAERSEKWE